MLPELEAAQGLLKYLYHHAKQELEGLDEDSLNWVPEGVEGVNSIYGMALHIATSQAYFAGKLAGQRYNLELPELEQGGDIFKLRGTSAERARTLLKQAAEIINEVFAGLTEERLALETTLPGGGKSNNHGWVMLLVSHTAEHVGHMAITRQYYKGQGAKGKESA